MSFRPERACERSGEILLLAHKRCLGGCPGAGVPFGRSRGGAGLDMTPSRTFETDSKSAPGRIAQCPGSCFYGAKRPPDARARDCATLYYDCRDHKSRKRGRKQGTPQCFGLVNLPFFPPHYWLSSLLAAATKRRRAAQTKANPILPQRLPPKHRLPEIFSGQPCRRLRP